jgi:hypothetical protein
MGKAISIPSRVSAQRPRHNVAPGREVQQPPKHRIRPDTDNPSRVREQRAKPEAW